MLRLKPLDLPGRAPDARQRGTAIHAALDAFLAATAAALPPDAALVFVRETQAALAEAAPWPAVRALWGARIARAAPWFVATEAERRDRAAPFGREVKGVRLLDGVPLPFAVTAKADRIDLAPDGGYAIYDYKSGDVPSAPEAAAFHLQLPLEAAIAEAGGFEGLPPGRAIHLELIGVGARKTRALAADPGETWRRLAVLIAAYQDPRQGFVARLRPQKLTYAGDYDHLSRFGEWADGDDPLAEDLT